MTAVIYNNKGECERIIRGIKRFKHYRLENGKQVFRFFCHNKSKHTLHIGSGTFELYEEI